MFISLEQLELSLLRIRELHPFFGMSFLAFKQAEIPVGKIKSIPFTRFVLDLLRKYYRPTNDYDGFYNPFMTSSPQERWVKPRYYETSVQRWTSDTFGDTLIHQKGRASWGWQQDYITKLEVHLGGTLIPAFDLGVWLFRFVEWDDALGPKQIADKLFNEFNITKEEKSELFDARIPPLPDSWNRENPIVESEILRLIGRPPGLAPTEGAALRILELNEVGPAKFFRYEPSERLNIITGDNSLGKTFILECAWWALTGEWLGRHAYPRRDVPKDRPRIAFGISTEVDAETSTVRYNWDRQIWNKPAKREALPGLVVYARYDGSFAVWDPARLQADQSQKNHIFITLDQVWEGLWEQGSGGKVSWICNGLLRDWITWQTGGERYSEHYSSLVACLEGLSPQGVERLKPGSPTRISGDSREIPTLQMPYGEVPVLNASAGVQRIIALAYILVWSWLEHLNLCHLRTVLSG